MNERFRFVSSPLPDVWIIERKPFEDERGLFSRLFCSDEFKNIGLMKPICQINHSVTKKRGTVRGLHCQLPPFAETKIVSCLHGEVFDVAIDVRNGSPTFLSWYATVLSPENHLSLFIPDGFAHGFQALTDDAEILYFSTAPYTPMAERGVNINDKRIGIKFPLEVSFMSEKDKSIPFLHDEFTGVYL